MITKLSRLKQCGIFQDFSWPAEGLHDFSRFNLIFGWNGTGKSTLSRILRNLQQRELPEGQVVQIECDDQTITASDFTNSTLPIKVFNRDFVEETVQGDLAPINVFGKKNIERKNELDKNNELETKLSEKIVELEGLASKAEKSFNQTCQSLAKDIKVSLGKEGNKFFNYDKRDFQKKADELLDLPAEEREIVDSETQQNLLTKTRSVAKENIEISTVELPDAKACWNTTAKLRERAVVTDAIAELSTDTSISNWVQEGLSLHRRGDAADCLYCGQRIPQERVTALEQHFNNAVEKLQNDISDAIVELETKKIAVDGIGYPKKAELTEHLADTYIDARRKGTTELAAISKALQTQIEQLREKHGKLFEKLPTPPLTDNLDSCNHEAVIALLKTHNEEASNFAEIAIAAQNKYERAKVIDSLALYQSSLNNKKGASDTLEQTRKQLDEVQTKITNLRAELISHQIPAIELTRDLAHYLGHRELTLEVTEEGYTLLRSGKPAKRLSDGEKTALAVLYFLKTFADESFKLEESIVIFDDPISSLDSNAIYNAFAFIKDRSSGAKQLIFLTHSFPFFRIIRSWFKNLRGKDKKKYRIMMLKTEFAADGRRSSLTDIDPLLKQFNSEYQYLFSCVHRVASEPQANQLEAYLPAPNIARRVLEAFLAFKAPMKGDGNFYAKLNHVERNEKRKSRIYRFVSSQSHLDAVGDSDEDVSWLSETPSVLKDVLALIEETDKDHYKGMVDYIKSVA